VSPNDQAHDVGEFVEVSVNWTETFGLGEFGGTYVNCGFAEKELTGASGLPGVTLTKPEHVPPLQEMVTFGVTLVTAPAIFTSPLGGVGVGVNTKVSAAGVLSPAI
jgi:hypothetical protein